MSIADDNGPERDDDMIAAEYVLGVLRAEERRTAARRIEAEPDFARLVDQWEVRLSPMADAYAEAEPPASVKTAIDRRLFAGGDRVQTSGSSWWSSLALWRGLAIASLAALALYVAVPYLAPQAGVPQNRLVASLAAEGSDVRYLALYDPETGNVALSHVSGERASGRDFELWMIEGNNPPVSMGVIPAGATTHIEIAPEAREKLGSGAVLAVSLEPAGGSPTGQPTGPVVAAGDLKNI